MRRIISIAVILILLSSSLLSCIPQSGDQSNGGGTDLTLPGDMTDIEFESMFPDGWIGGFGQININFDVEYWWLDSFDELSVAIEKLKDNGSVFSEESVLVDYDGELFDVKYCIVICPYLSDSEWIKFGEDPFDRYADGVEIRTVGFLDNVTVEQINYSHLSSFRAFKFEIEAPFYENYVKNHNPITPFTDEWSFTTNVSEYSSNMSVYAPNLGDIAWFSGYGHNEATNSFYLSKKDVDSFLSHSKFYMLSDFINEENEGERFYK